MGEVPQWNVCLCTWFLNFDNKKVIFSLFFYISIFFWVEQIAFFSWIWDVLSFFDKFLKTERFGSRFFAFLTHVTQLRSRHKQKATSFGEIKAKIP